MHTRDHLLLCRRHEIHDFWSEGCVTVLLHIIHLDLLLGRHATADGALYTVRQVHHTICTFVKVVTLLIGGDARDTCDALANTR